MEIVVDPGGLTNVGYELWLRDPSVTIGTMVAGNSGRPGGACGMADGSAGSLHAHHKTQEEDVVSNWLLTAGEGRGLENANRLYREHLHMQWGMKHP